MKCGTESDRSWPVRILLCGAWVPSSHLKQTTRREKPHAACPSQDPHHGRRTHTARRHLGRPRRQLRAVLGQCHQGRAVPVRRRRRDANWSASSCRNTPTRSGTATCRTRGPAQSTAIACTARTSPEDGHRFNPNKLLLDPYAKAHGRRAEMGPRGVRLHDRGRRRRPDLRRARQRAVHAEMPRRSTRPSPGAATARRRCRGTARSSTNPRPRLHQAASGRAGSAARHLRRPRDPRR